MIANKSKTRFALIPVALISALSLGACAENYSAEGGLAGAAAGAGLAAVTGGDIARYALAGAAAGAAAHDYPYVVGFPGAAAYQLVVSRFLRSLGNTQANQLAEGAAGVLHQVVLHAPSGPAVLFKSDGMLGTDD